MRFYLSLFLFSLCALLAAFPAEASGTLSGEAEWRYGRYEAEEGDVDLKADGFAQRYSLLYQTGGLINHGRGGKYDVGLGAEWASLDSDIGEENVNIDTLKLLYRGNILLAPGGLPFRLHLYSEDMTRTTFLEDSGPAGIGRSILDPNIVSDVSNGQHIRTGATFMIGIRNGSYMGQYRDVLSRFPRLFIDYQEDYVRNLESDTPQHYRTRNLAFVSLNKKDNWFHYRYLDYQDFENEKENFVEKVYMLGTVDHTLQRQWINLTNWIKVSVDGSFTTTSRVETDKEPDRRYDLNLFATARRPGWQASTFSTFNRLTEEGKLTKSLEVPLFISGEIDRNTSWRFRFVGSRDRRTFFETESEADEDIAFMSARLEKGKQRKFIVAPEVSAEVKRGELGEGYAAKASIEAYTNNRYRPEMEWFGSYSVARFAGTGSGGTDVDYLEQQLTGKLEREFSARLRSGIIQDLIYGTGTIDRSVSQNITPRGDQGLAFSSNAAETRTGDTFRSTSTWYGEYRGALRLDNRLELSYDYLRNEGEADDQFVLSHSMNYRTPSLYFDMRNRLTMGDSLENTRVSSEQLNVFSTGDVDTTFEHYNSLRYSPGRVWETTLTNEIDWRSGDNGSSTRWLGRQTYLHNFFSSNGFSRKLADLGEELEYERFTDISGDVRSLTTFTLLGNWYPSRIALLAAKIRYRQFNPEDFDEIAYFLSAGLNFKKFTVALDYAYGTRTASDTTEKRKEHRWEVQVKKTF